MNHTPEWADGMHLMPVQLSDPLSSSSSFAALKRTYIFLRLESLVPSSLATSNNRLKSAFLSFAASDTPSFVSDTHEFETKFE